MSSELLMIFIKIFFMVAFGYVLAKRNIITDEMNSNLSDLLIKGIFPITIISSAKFPFSFSGIEGIGLTTVIALFYYFIAVVISYFLIKKSKLPQDSKKIFITMSVFANTGFIGIPLASEVYGNQGMLFAVTFNMCYNLVFFTYGTNLLSGKKFKISALFNGIIISSLIAIILYVLPFRFPEVVYHSLDSIGNMTTPISMIIIGAQMAKSKILSTFQDPYSYLVSFLRLLFFPLLIGIVLYVCNVDSTVAKVCILSSALPAGSLNVIMSAKYHCDPDFAAKTVVQSMLFMMFSIPFILWITELAW